jgi:hypothetical protein
MKTTVRTEAEAVRASMPRKLLKPDWYDGLITAAIEKVAQRSGNDTIELTVEIGDRTFRDWLSDADKGAAKLRHCAEACGEEVFERYASGQVDQSDFPGHHVQVRVGIQKGTRAYPGDRNVIEDYRAPADDSRVVNLHAAN